jgi:hypothetical protein
VRPRRDLDGATSIRPLLPLLLPAALAAQDSGVRVIVADTGGTRIPFAVVLFEASTRRIASDSGIATYERGAADSLRLVVRRIGYAPFEGWVARSGDGSEYAVALTPLPQTLRTVQVRAPEDNRLFRAGFYRRLDERLRTPSRSEFFTPEDLDQRNAGRVTHLLQGVGFLRIEQAQIGPGSASYDLAYVVLGRGRCYANILLDGNVPAALVEEWLAEADVRSRARGVPVEPRPESVTPLDRLLQPGSIAGLEVYATASLAPDELRSKARRPTCPLVAIWTGARR